jgi:hypothetical protein
MANPDLTIPYRAMVYRLHDAYFGTADDLKDRVWFDFTSTIRIYPARLPFADRYEKLLTRGYIYQLRADLSPLLGLVMTYGPVGSVPFGVTDIVSARFYTLHRPGPDLTTINSVFVMTAPSVPFVSQTPLSLFGGFSDLLLYRYIWKYCSTSDGKAWVTREVMEMAFGLVLDRHREKAAELLKWLTNDTNYLTIEVTKE